jgi:hypothetical protein
MSQLTAYNLACGCVQKTKIGADTIELYREHSTYHVRRFSAYVDGQRRVQEFWGVFETVKDARRAYNRQKQIAKEVAL